VLLFRSGRIGIDNADQRAQCDPLRRRFAGMGWETARLLDALDVAYDYYFDEMAQVRMPRWSSGQIALLGDAAFGPSPLSGQGTSLALIGAYLLAHQLDAAPDVVTAFSKWENGFRAHVILESATGGVAESNGPRGR
jgi:2-polyprenyl-6-methoxyphenol hydroxylase-like FAD-dependent oxidoreductase